MIPPARSSLILPTHQRNGDFSCSPFLGQLEKEKSRRLLNKHTEENKLRLSQSTAFQSTVFGMKPTKKDFKEHCFKYEDGWKKNYTEKSVLNKPLLGTAVKQLFWSCYLWGKKLVSHVFLPFNCPSTLCLVLTLRSLAFCSPRSCCAPLLWQLTASYVWRPCTLLPQVMTYHSLWK